MTTLKIEGLKDLEKALMKLPLSTGKSVLRKVLLKAAEPIKNRARDLAPDDPKTPDIDLNTSIEASTKQRRGYGLRGREGNQAATVYIGPTKDGYPQAIMQEFGTIHHAAQPYMRPAWDGGKNKALDDIKDGLWKEIEKSAARLAKKAAKRVK